jgi:hypothetical protein
MQKQSHPLHNATSCPNSYTPTYTPYRSLPPNIKHFRKNCRPAHYIRSTNFKHPQLQQLCTPPTTPPQLLSKIHTPAQTNSTSPPLFHHPPVSKSIKPNLLLTLVDSSVPPTATNTSPSTSPSPSTPATLSHPTPLSLKLTPLDLRLCRLCKPSRLTLNPQNPTHQPASSSTP